MTGIVVQNDPVNPGQEPFAHGLVHIELVTGTGGGAGYTGSGSIIGTFTTQTDANGNWSATLTPNSLITPANTHYKVTEGFAVSPIVVPPSGGPYNLSQLLVTPPPTPGAPGITGVQVAVGGTVDGVRPEINFIAGANVGISAVDNPGADRVDVTINAAGGGGGGAVSSVFGRTGAVVPAGGDYSFSQLSGSAAAGQLPRLDQITAPAAAVSLASQKVTNLANGSTPTDGAAFGQIPLIGAAGSGAAKALSANDPTTANSRPPTAHATTHAASGSDVLTPDAIGAVSSDWASMIGAALLTARFTESAVTYQQTPGDFVLCLCTPSKTKSISSLALWVTVGGVTGSGVNALALFDEAGNLIDQTGDMTATWSAAGMVYGAMGGSHTVTAGVNYYLGFLTHFSGTSPHLAATGTAQTANFPVVDGHRTAIFRSGVAAIPSSFDPTSYTPNSGYFIMSGR